MKAHSLLALSISVFAGPLLALDGGELLQRMSESMQQKNYSGTFVYRHKDKVETLKIIHRNTDKGVNERLITLSGKPREIIRDEAVVTCIWPDSKLVLVDKSHDIRVRKHRFPGFVPKQLEKLPTSYDLELLPDSERVAGRSAHVVVVKPKDQYRYGYRLWIDQDSGLLLRSDLLNERVETVEQVLFTELNVHDQLPDQAFEPELLQEGFQWREVSQTAKEKDVANAQNGHWRASALPPGFSLQIHSQRVTDTVSEPVEHMIFSDGLASVSVFIEPHQNDEPVKRDIRRGALHVYGRRLNGHRIVVLGEVPGSTVKLIADSIEPQK